MYVRGLIRNNINDPKILYPSDTSLHSLHFISHHFTSHHFTSFHLTSLHFNSLHLTSLNLTSSHINSHHFTSPHFTPSFSLFFVYFTTRSRRSVVNPGAKMTVWHDFSFALCKSVVSVCSCWWKGRWRNGNGRRLRRNMMSVIRVSRRLFSSSSLALLLLIFSHLSLVLLLFLFPPIPPYSPLLFLSLCFSFFSLFSPSYLLLLFPFSPSYPLLLSPLPLLLSFIPLVSLLLPPSPTPRLLPSSLLLLSTYYPLPFPSPSS